MKYKCIIVLFFACLSAKIPFAQTTVTILDSGKTTSLRGLSVVDDNVFWASGSNGTVARSVNGGKTIQWLTVKGYAQRDFRDIEAIDSNTAIIMAIAEPAIILKTRDAGKTWYKVFEDTSKGMFLDAMDFTDLYGIVIGDPVNSKMFIAETYDYGETWTKKDDLPLLDSGEAMFASSGTNSKALNTSTYKRMIVTGGLKSSVILLPVNRHLGNIRLLLPLVQGKESTGANSLAVYRKNMFVVGGDFSNDKDTVGNSAYSSDNGKTWKKPITPPHGYRSCVEYITSQNLIACGTSGIDISADGGKNWQLISRQSFHVCQLAKNGSKVYLAGSNGKIAVLEIK